MLLSAVGGAAGVALAYGLTHGLVALDPLKIPRVQDIALDGRVLAFTAAISLAHRRPLRHRAGAAVVARPICSRSLKEGGRDSHVATGWLRRALVVGEIAASVVLVAAALLLARSFARLLDVDAGFNPAHVLTLRTSLPSGDLHRRRRDGERVRRGRPPAARVARRRRRRGAVTGLPLASTRGDWGIRIEGRPTIRRRRARRRLAGGDARLLRGARHAAARAAAPSPTPIAPIRCRSSSSTRRWRRNSGRAIEPIGRRMTMGSNDRWITVVGVVADVHHRGLDARAAAGDVPAAHAIPLRRAERAGGVDDDLGGAHGGRSARGGELRARGRSARSTRSSASRMSRRWTRCVADSTSDRRLNMLLFALLGGAGARAGHGRRLRRRRVFGVAAHARDRRAHGDRRAAGTTSCAWCSAKAAGWRWPASCSGSIVALAGARLIRGLLFEVSATDPLTFVAVAAGLLGVALLASYIPARRATRVDPMIALRGE